ncbi:MAG: tRNA (cytidine(34)-2'-O)-methyltransferase [Oligoflexales bacterium]
MKKNHPHICLFQPEIPQNVGSIARLAAATACRLHLVKPFGFSTSDKNLRRPGLDYWPFLDLEIHDSISELLNWFPEKVAFFSKRGTQHYSEISTDTEMFIFGRETTGLPADIHESYKDKMYKIPMFHPGVRSLNLANSVAIVVYDQLSRRGLFSSEVLS